MEDELSKSGMLQQPDTNPLKLPMIDLIPEKKVELYEKRRMLLDKLDHAITTQVNSVSKAQQSVDFLKESLPSEVKQLLNPVHIKEGAEEKLGDVIFLTSSLAETYAKCRDINTHAPGIKEGLTRAKWESDGDCASYEAVIDKASQLTAKSGTLIVDLSKLLDMLRPVKDTLAKLVPPDRQTFVPERL